MRARLLALFADLWAWPITAAGRLAARWGRTTLAATPPGGEGASWHVAVAGGLCARFFAWSGACAFAWGDVVIVVGEWVLGDECLVRHEREHGWQARRWGLLFPVAYPVAGCWAVCRGGSWYWDNAFEVAARAAE
jgi:hypothetical protein